MASFKEYTASGGASEAFSIPSFTSDEIKVRVAGVLKTATTHYNITSYTTNGGTVTWTSGNVPASGTSVYIYRDTKILNNANTDVEGKATYSGGTPLYHDDLNNNQKQVLRALEEKDDQKIQSWDLASASVETSSIKDGTIVDADINASAAIAQSKLNIADATGSASGYMSAANFTKLGGIETGATADQTAAEIRTAVEAASDSNVFTDADHTKLNGIATGAEVNVQSDWNQTSNSADDFIKNKPAILEIIDEDDFASDTATKAPSQQSVKAYITATSQPIDAELTELATMGSTTAAALADLTEAEVKILDGATVTTAELNILDGVTSTTAELNILDGVTATAAELNIMDGVTATTAELNKTDGLTSTPTELNILDGATANTSEINKLDGVTASTAELNIVAGKSFKTSSGTLDTTSDTEIPSSKVIAAHVASSQTAIGGFVTIADEVSFPNTQPANGVVVSINNAADLVINGSGVSTSAKRLDNTTVTINGFPSSLNGETLAPGVGLVVTSTSTANTYTYHKLLASETDVKSLSDDINDFNARYRVAGSEPGSNNDAGDLYFDTAANKMKVYNGNTSQWDDVASVGNFYINTLSGSNGANGNTSGNFDNSAKRFTLSNPPTMAQQLIVSINGVIQKPNSGTSPSEGFAIDGNDIIFAAAPATGSDYFIVTQGSSVSIGTPSDNTVTSAKIVDGSIVNGDISSTANIAGSKVADDSIPEVKLDISNAPSDGKFLQYKDSSDKLTWATVDSTPEGTAIKSTGESGTTKFLRTDGDGTSSWQVPPSYTHPNHSGEVTSSADGAQTIASNVVDEDNLKVSNSPTDGQFLQAQSGNAGGLTWASVSAAPTVDLVADGAIGNNVACNIKSNGKVEAVTEVAAGTNHATVSTGSSPSYTTTTYDREHNVIVTFFQQSSELKCVVGTPSGEGANATFTWGSVQTLDTSQSAYKYITAEYIYFNDTNKHVVCFINGSSGNFSMMTLVVDIASDGTATTGALNTVVTRSGNTGLNAERGEICNGHETGYPYLVFYIKSNSDQLQWRDGTINTATNGTTSSGGGNCLGPGSSRMRDGMYCLSYMENTRNTIMCRDNGSPTWYYNTRIAGGWKTSTAFSPTGISSLTMFYDSTSSKIFALYTESGTLRYKTGDPNTASTGGGITGWSSATDIRTTVNGWHGNHPIVEYDTKHSKYWLMLSEDSPAQKTWLWGFTIAANAAITWDSSLKEIHNGQRQAKYLFYESSKGNMVATQDTDVWTSYGASSTMDSSNFLGWSNAAASDGNTATVKVVGNTVTGLSGLTPGKKYYVQRDGSVGLTPVSGTSVEAGVALTSSSILLK